jgi:UDP-N-acetylmuramate dehydrogenase
MKILRNVNLQQFNTFGVKAELDKMVLIQSHEDVIRYLNSEDCSETAFIIGGGSNILYVNDKYSDAIKNDIKGLRIIEDSDESVLVEVGAGVIWHDFLLECLKNGHYGLENLALIPGTVGAAPVQNIGAYGIEQEECFDSLTGVLRDTAETLIFSKEKCKFSYRSSIFKTSLKNRFIITSVRYRLKKKYQPVLKYKELSEKFAQSKNFSPVELFDYICQVRENKLPDYRDYGNAGSFFKNPIISIDTAEELKVKYTNVPLYAFEDAYKVSAAWLIEEAGLKGTRISDAGVSEKHALILINYGNASGKDIYNLSQRITDEVEKLFGIRLEREVNIIGEI